MTVLKGTFYWFVTD